MCEEENDYIVYEVRLDNIPIYIGSGKKGRDIDSSEKLVTTILYINQNPVKHGITKDGFSYPYSSASDIIKNNNTFIESDDIINLFDGVDGFKNSLQNYDV